MLRILTIGVILILIMAAVSAGEWTQTLGGFCREIAPLIAFLVYIGFGYITGSKLESLPTASKSLVACALAAHFILYATPFMVGYHEASAKLAESMSKEKGAEVSYSEAASSLDLFLNKETGFNGVPAYAVYSERRSLAAANIKEYAARQFENVDDLLPLLAALLNIVLYVIPMALKWLLTDTLSIVHEPGYIGLVFWYVVALGFFTFGFAKGVE